MKNDQIIKIIKHPRVTEKSSDLMSQNVYVFDVALSANKQEVEKAVYQMYKVKPVKVNMVKVPAKKILTRGIRGVKSGGKKAFVFLKEGDKIEFV